MFIDAEFDLEEMAQEDIETLFKLLHEYCDDENCLTIAKEYGELSYLVGDYENGFLYYGSKDFSCAEDAAKQFVEDGEWGESDKTLVLDIRVRDSYTFCGINYEDVESVETFTVYKEPKTPPCLEGYEHEFVEIAAVPDIGNGAGVISRDFCEHCYTMREIDTYATNPNNGSQGEAVTKYYAKSEHCYEELCENKFGGQS